MAKEEIKNKPIEEQIEEVKTESVTAHKVKKEFVYDKPTPYKPGSTVYLPEGKIKETLISNKFI